MHGFKAAGGCRQKPRLQMLIMRFCSNWKMSTSQNCESLKNFIKKPISKWQVGPCDLVMQNSCVFLGRSQVFPICRRGPLFFPQHLGSYFRFIVRQHVDNKVNCFALEWTDNNISDTTTWISESCLLLLFRFYIISTGGGWEEAALHRHGCTLYAL